MGPVSPLPQAGPAAGALVLMLVLGCLAAPGGRADESLPEHTHAVLQGYPPYAPDPGWVLGAAQREAWATAMEACAARLAPGHARASIYASAAEAWRLVPHGVVRADACLRAALADLDDAHPLDALVRLSLLDLALGEHLAPDALALGAAAWAWLERPAPPQDDPGAPLHAFAQAHIRAHAPPALLHHATLEGDLLTASMWAEAMAEAPLPAWGPPALLHEQAARAAYRAGRITQAHEHAHAGRQAAHDDETQARLAFWDLHLAHGLLSPTGLLRPAGTVRPGSLFVDDLAQLCTSLRGNTQAGGFLLCSASCALASGALEEALAIYRLALEDEHLMHSAHRDESLWAGLLPAVSAAQALGRLDEAERLLARIEQVAGEPVPQARGLRERLARLRSGRDAASGAGTAARRRPGRLEVRSPEARGAAPVEAASHTRGPGDPHALAPAGDAEDDAWRPWALALSVAGGLTLAGVAAIRVRRARRARGPVVAGGGPPRAGRGSRPGPGSAWGRDAR